MVIKGTVVKIIHLNENMSNLILRKKEKGSYVTICFLAFEEQKRIIHQLNVIAGDGVKITAHIFSKKYNEKYYTSIVIDKLVITNKKTDLSMVDLTTGELL